jgi:hypothetical protein
MADNLTDEQIELLRRALEELRKSTVMSDKTQAELNAAMKKDAGAFEDNTKAVNDNTSVAKDFVKDLSGLGNELGAAIGQIRESREDFRSLNPAIRAAGTIFGATGKAIGSMAEGTGEAVQGLAGLNKGFKGFTATMVGGGLIKAFGSGLKSGSEAAANMAVAFGEFATGELQTVVEAYRKVGSAGAIGAGGMNELYESSNQLGIGLQGMAEIVSRNSKSLAYAGGSTLAGRKALVDLTANSKDYEDKLLALGYTFTEMRDQSAKFLERNRTLGTVSAGDQRRLGEANNAYMMQLDQLARITGKSRDELAKQLDQQMKDVRFQATLRTMEAKNGVENRAAIENIAATIGKEQGDYARKGFMDAMSGAINTPEAQAFLQTLDEGGRQAVQDLRNGAIKDTVVGFREITKSQARWYEGKGGDEVFGRIAGMGSAIEPMIGALQKARTLDDKYYDAMGKTTAEQNAAANAQDKATKDTVEAQKKLQQMGQKLDEIVRQKVLPTAASSIKSFTTAIDDFVDIASKALGTKKPTTGIGAGGGGTAPVQSSSAAEDMAWGGTNVGGTAGAPTPPGSPVEGSTAQVLSTIKGRESGGNYQAQAKGSSASGAYQFTDSTWQGLTKKYGFGTEFAKAKDAPPEVQDAVASKYVDEILKKAGGDVSKVPVAWYTGNLQGKMSDAALAANKGQTAAQYQSKWMADYTKTMGGGAIAGATIAQAQVPPPPQQMTPEQVAAIKQQMWEGRKRMAAKDPNGKVITQLPGEPWAANGGVFSGPKGGYSATLHGNEAVVPLPSGNEIPVDMAGMGDVFDEQLSLLEDQTSSLEELLRTLRQGADLSQRILRASQA